MRKYTILLTLFFCLTISQGFAQSPLGLLFDGVDDRVTIPYSSTYNLATGQFALEAWIKADAVQPNAEPTIFSNREAGNANTGIQLFLLNGKITARIGGTVTPSYGNDLRDGNCHHVAVRRFSGGIIHFIIDGGAYSNGFTSTQSVNTTHAVWLGEDEPTAATSRFKGVIHEVRFYSTAISSTSKRFSYFYGNETYLIGYWRMNDGSGQTIDDLTATNNNGNRGATSATETSDPTYVAGCMCTTTAAITSAGGTVICNAAGITLSANTGTGLTYQWLKNGGEISGATSSTYAALTAGTFTCRIVNASCGNTSNAIVLTATNPTVSLNYTGSLYVCTGGSTTFTSSVTNGGTPTYQWKLNGTNITGATSATYVANQPGNYTLLVTNTTNGCSALSSNSYTLTVFTTAPTASISYLNQSSGCGQVYMQVTGGAQSGYTYQWKKNGVNVSFGTNSSYGANSYGAYTCSVTNACGTTTTNTLYPTILGTGEITFSGNLNTCNPSVTLSAPYFSDAGYQWRNDLGDIQGANSYTYLASGAGNYSCAIVTTSCGVLASINTVKVDGKPSINSPLPLEFCTGGSATLYAYGDSTATAYQWTLNGTAISGATSSNYTASSSGTYGCSVTSSVCGLQNSNVLTLTSGATPQVTTIGPGSFGNVDVCGYTYSAIYVVPANAGTYSLNDLYSGSPLLSQTDNVFGSPGTGLYTVSLDNGCGTTYTSPIGVRDITSYHVIASDNGVTSFCSNTTPPYLYVRPAPPWWGSTAPYGPTWDTYNWKLNGVTIPSVGTNPSIQPTQTGWYSCTVTNSCDTAWYVDSLFITVSQLPVVNVTAGGPLTFCQGQSVTFTANVVSGANYTWYRNGNSVQYGTSNVYTATISGTYKVAITNGTCSAVNSADQVVTVTVPPSQYVSTNSPATLCAPGSILLTAPTGNTYEWYRSQTTGVIGTNSTYNATISGNYYVRVIDAQGCYYNSYQQVVFIGNPVNIINSQYSSTCENGNVSLSTDFVGGTALSYQWKKNGVAISGATGNFYNFTGGPSAIGNYTIEITTECGIIGSTTFSYTTFTPFSASSSPSGNILACTPGTISLSATTGANLKYQWYKDGSSLSGATTANYTATSSGKYGVTITDTVTGCSVYTYNTAPANINYGNLAAAITPATGTLFCNSVTLSANGVGGDTYQWRKNSTNISGATSQSYTATTTGTYSVVITNSCGSPSIVSKVVYIAPATLTGLTITSAYPNPQCSGGGVSMSVSPGQASGSVSYQWKLNGTAIANAINSYYNTNTAGGSYTCDVTNGCGTATTTAYNLTFNPSPAATITATGPTNLCNGASVTLNASTGTGNTYQWSGNGIAITGATTSSYTTTVGGTYRCKVTNASSCSATSGFINVFTSTGTAPTASIAPSGTVNICTGTTQTLTANTGSGFTYQWKKNGTNITGATTITYGATTTGTYTVVVTSACGSATSIATTVNVGATTATITPGGSTTVCSGGVVLNANTGTGLSYQWKNNGVNIGGATAASYTATTSGSYTVVVTATGGCSATSTATTVSIGGLSAAVTPSGTITLCSGTSTTLSATAGTGYTYQWYRNNVLLSATGQTFTTSTAGTYKCVVTSGSCTATSNSVVIVVNTTPNATVSYTTPLSFCSPGSVTFIANALSGAAYQWENNSVAIAGATAQTYVATAAGVYRVKETKNGCVDYSSTKTVTTATTVTAAITTPDPVAQCTGGVVNMSVTNPIPGYTHQWKKNNVSIAGATGTSYAATTTGSYTVAITAGCGTATSNAIAVTIGSVSAVVSPAGSATLCVGSSVVLTANAGSGYSYQWKKNNVNITGATTSTYTVTTAGSYTVAITALCGNATSAATVVTQAATVTASVTPAGTSTVCSGSSITFTANTGTGYTYKWYRNNVLLSATGQTFTTATAGSYKVEVSISGSCAVQSNTVTLTVINNPTPTITAGGPTTFCAGQSVTFTANTLTGATYQWQKNSTNIAGATAQTYTATTAGSYRVQETKSGCSKYSSKKTVTVNCRLGDETSDETTNTVMEVYPNPFADKLNINITSQQTEQTEIKVMDVLGKVQYSQQITTNTTTELNTQLPAGVYMINAIVDGQVKTVRVVKTK